MKKVTRVARILIVLLSVFLLSAGAWAQTTLLNEGFEGGSLPAGWSQNYVYGTTAWTYQAGSQSGTPAAAHTGTKNANLFFANYYVKTELITPALDFTGFSAGRLSFWRCHGNWAGDQDSLTVLYRTTASGAWRKLALYNNSLTTWTQTTITIPTITSTTQICFRGCANYGYGICLDDILVQGLSYGTLAGVVKNNYTGAFLGGATITITPAAGGPYTSAAGTGAWTTAANSVLAGTYTVTCSATGFVTQTTTAVALGNQTVNVNFSLNPIPGTITGVVTSCATGAPLEGVTLKFGLTGQTTQSIAGGLFTIPVYPGGTNSVYASKPGFQDFQSGTTITVTPPGTATYNFCMLENLNPPNTPFTAALNTPQTAVNLQWGTPIGQYMLIYDDGVQDNWTVWATANNKNAVKFQPVGYPATVSGVQINVGSINNYPAGSNPQIPFKVGVYDASGANGTPGALLGALETVTPAAGAFGYINYTFAAPVVINSGSFYIAMIQGGNAPNAMGLAIDTTTQQLRSYSQFGTGPWLPASGNFMIRAIITGTGGPLLAATVAPNPIQVTASAIAQAIYQTKPSTVTGFEGKGTVIPIGGSPDMVTGYEVFRLQQGQEAQPTLWTSIGSPTATNMVDAGWPSLPCAPYLWAVKAQYTGNRWSNPILSNIVEKCWLADVTVNFALSCDSTPNKNTYIELRNLTYSDTVYTFLTTDNSTSHIFHNVWKGNYKLTVKHFGYTDFMLQPVSVMGDITVNATMLQIKFAPTGLNVDNRSLLATWNAPVPEISIFTENFSSGSFTTNAWVTAGGSNWAVSTANGNPAPAAEFNYLPHVTSYSQTLTSKPLAGLHSPIMRFQYDIFLSNYGNTTLNQMAVELWDGTTWHTLKNYDNSTGSDIPWTSEDLDVSTYTNTNFKIRFRAYGDDSNDINNWDIDNINIYGTLPPGPDPCLLGYNFYLNTVLDANIPGPNPATTYVIPPSHVHYGTSYHACVLAVYSSGFSGTSCFDFISKFLYPPTNIAAIGIEDAAYITWNKPAIYDLAAANPGARVAATVSGEKNDVAENTGAGLNYHSYIPLTNADGTYDNGTLINSPGTGTGGADESILEGTNYGSNAQLAGGFSIADDFVVPAGAGWDVNKLTAFSYQTNAPNTGSITACYIRIYNGAPNAGGTIVYGDMTTNRMTTQTFSNIYRVSAAGGGTARAIMKIECTVSSLHLAPGTYWIEFAYAGNASYTGPWIPYVVGTPPTPANAMQYAAGAWAALADGTAARGIPFLVEYAGGTGGTPPGLIGYKVYRDQAFIHYVPSPDTLHYYDMHLEPGNYCYDVSAWYKLDPYGLVGQFDESLMAPNGPACVNISYGIDLPFTETWGNPGGFTFYNWTFGTAGQGNWSVNNTLGNPAPCADFSWQPIHANYSYSIESPVLNAAAWTCADIWLDFDYKLIDRAANGKEKLMAEIYLNGEWKSKDSIANNGSVEWTGKHIELKGAKGKGFKIRFRAKGASTDNIIHWYVDNVHVYGVCKSPVLNAASQSHFTTNLTWAAPVCGGGGQVMDFIFDDGTAENGWAISAGYVGWLGNEFPIAATMSGVLQQFSVYFEANTAAGTDQLTIEVFDGTQTSVGMTDPFTPPTDAWLDIAVNDIPFDGMFYAMVKWNNTAAATNYLALDESGPYAAQDLEWYYDGTTWDKIWIAAGQGNPGVYLLRAKALVSGDLKQVELTPATPFVPGQITATPAKFKAANRSIDTKNYGTMQLTSVPDSSALVGYNIYRTDATGIGSFTVINPAPWTTTTYADTYDPTLETGTFKYFVTALFQNSQNPGLGVICEPHSDTITVSFPALGTNDLSNSSINIYPNPANDVVNVVATSNIKNIEILNYIGQTIYTKSADAKQVQLNVSSYKAGVYFVKITTASGMRTTKITVTH